MISIEDRRLDRLFEQADRWFLPFVILFFLVDAVIAWPYALSFLGWLVQVILGALLVFPVSAFLAYLVWMVMGRVGPSTNALRLTSIVLLILIGLYGLVFVIGFAMNPDAYESGLFGMVIPLGIAAATLKFWNHSLQ